MVEDGDPRLEVLVVGLSPDEGQTEAADFGFVGVGSEDISGRWARLERQRGCGGGDDYGGWSGPGR